MTRWREALDALGEPHPVFELTLRRLAATRPPGRRHTVVHGDFRNGNLIVGPEGIRAVLDWELAHSGDPLEDLGWLCVKAWRFGERLPVGGFGAYDELLHAYEEAGGQAVDREALRWWETFGVLKWGSSASCGPCGTCAAGRRRWSWRRSGGACARTSGTCCGCWASGRAIRDPRPVAVVRGAQP
ncbi:phosphotransferase family protein [Nonomuraea antimicrobica]